MRIKVDLRGFAEYNQGLARFPLALAREIIRTIDFTTLEIANTAKSNHPYIDRTEILTNSIGIVPAREAIGGFEGVAQATAEYAEPVEFGNRHAGPHPFMYPAAEKSEDALARRLEQAARRAARKVKL